jgi:hypothetical protein
MPISFLRDEGQSAARRRNGGARRGGQSRDTRGASVNLRDWELEQFF